MEKDMKERSKLEGVWAGRWRWMVDTGTGMGIDMGGRGMTDRACGVASGRTRGSASLCFCVCVFRCSSRVVYSKRKLLRF